MTIKTTHELHMTIVLTSVDDDAKISDMADVLANLGLHLREDVRVYVEPACYDVTDVEVDWTFSHAESHSGGKRPTIPPGSMPTLDDGTPDLSKRE